MKKVVLSLSGLFFDAIKLYKLPLQQADAIDAREEVEIQESLQLGLLMISL